MFENHLRGLLLYATFLEENLVGRWISVINSGRLAEINATLFRVCTYGFHFNCREPKLLNRHQIKDQVYLKLKISSTPSYRPGKDIKHLRMQFFCHQVQSCLGFSWSLIIHQCCVCRQWTHGDQIWIQRVSSAPATRLDVINLQVLRKKSLVLLIRTLWILGNCHVVGQIQRVGHVNNTFIQFCVKLWRKNWINNWNIGKLEKWGSAPFARSSMLK